MVKRLFFAISVVASLFIVVIVTSGWFLSQDLPPEVAAGYNVWQENGCIGCHTLYGQGGAFAPDLTHIYEQRGADYLREFMVNPNAFHPDQRLMPRFGLTVNETDNLLAFLDWATKQEPAVRWPPRLIAVSGSGSLTVAAVPEITAPEASPQDAAIARGRAIYSRAPAVCSTCHSLEPEVRLVGPSLYGIATTAAERVSGQSAEDYIRTSILNPSDHIVEGFPDAMQKNFAETLSADEINDLIVFLLTQER